MHKIHRVVRSSVNYDWVIGILLLTILVLVVVFQYLQREAKLRVFFTQNFIDSGNIFPTYLLVSFIYVLLFSTFFAFYLPVIPPEVEKFSLFGYSLNRFGFVLLVSSLYYLLRFFLTFFFYSSIGEDRKWARLYFVTSKFYMALSFVLMAGILLVYFFEFNALTLLRFSLLIALLLFVFKLFFYLFNRNYFLPKAWYYKILYICTLQFLPVLVLWKLLFL